jgi:glycosyltransferase involved in cell wall biosynthesis
MRILHVYALLDPAQGGPPIVVENLTREQIKLGHDVRVAAEVVCGFDSVPTQTLPRHAVIDLFRRPRADDVSLATWADVVHLHGMWEPMLPCVARAARTVGRPYVISPHGMLDPWSLAQKRWKKKLALSLGYRRMLDRAGAIHVLNADEQKLIGPLKLAAPSEVIPIGISFDQFDPAPDPAPFRGVNPGPGQRPFILFVSRLHFKKGLDYLADAFAKIAPKFPEHDLVVAGPDGGEQSPFLQRVEKLGLSKRVWLAGFLSDEMKRSALAAATVYCLPSRQEGFSMAILEAMACRLPVVISDQCHFPEVAEAGAGRIVPLDANAVANALESVLSNAADRTRMGNAGRELVASRYTWPKVAERFVSLYRRVAPAAGKLN